MTWRERVKELRRRKGWTQAELARRLGLALFTIQRWEIGSSEPSKENKRRLELLAKTEEEPKYGWPTGVI